MTYNKPRVSEIKEKNKEAGVDWITCTTTKKSVGLDWYAVFESMARAVNVETGGKSQIKDRRIRGYRGKECDGMYWGHCNGSPFGWMIIARGNVANRAWTTIAPTPQKNVTRLDLQVTIKINHNVPFAKVHYEQRPDKKRPVYSYREDSRGGGTVYVGSRSSDIFGRCYDKGAQQKRKAGDEWRYEVQINEPLRSMPLLSELYDQWVSDRPVLASISKYVHAWFKNRGVSPAFNPGDGPDIVTGTSVSITTVQRKLRWLNLQVAPTVEELISLGLHREVMVALGISADQLSLWEDLPPQTDVYAGDQEPQFILEEGALHDGGYS